MVSEASFSFGITSRALSSVRMKVYMRRDLLDCALDAADLDPVADPQWLGHRDHQPGDEVSERSLGGEADDQAQHRRGREQTARHSAYLGDHEQRREQPDRHDPGRDRPAQDAVARHRLRRLVGARDPRSISRTATNVATSTIPITSRRCHGSMAS